MIVRVSSARTTLDMPNAPWSSCHMYIISCPMLPYHVFIHSICFLRLIPCSSSVCSCLLYILCVLPPGPLSSRYHNATSSSLDDALMNCRFMCISTATIQFVAQESPIPRTFEKRNLVRRAGVCHVVHCHRFNWRRWTDGENLLCEGGLDVRTGLTDVPSRACSRIQERRDI